VPRHPPVEGLTVVSTVHWLVLALVMEKPSYGYELGERYDRRFGSFLPAGRPAIYSGLDRLAEVELVAPVPPGSGQRGGARRVRIVYRATRAAVRAHGRWLASSVPADRWHIELLARIGTAHLQGLPALLELLSRYAQHADLHIERLDELIADRSAGKQKSLAALCAMLLLREQQSTVTAQLQWMRSAREAIELRGQAGR
jgi:DNA-binding PadR family transcriptional regulator